MYWNILVSLILNNALQIGGNVLLVNEKSNDESESEILLLKQ